MRFRFKIVMRRLGGLSFAVTSDSKLLEGVKATFENQLGRQIFFNYSTNHVSKRRFLRAFWQADDALDAARPAPSPRLLEGTTVWLMAAADCWWQLNFPGHPGRAAGSWRCAARSPAQRLITAGFRRDIRQMKGPIEAPR